MDGKESYRDLERLMELGRWLHSQAIFESLARLVARTRHFGKGLSERKRQVKQA